MAAKDVNTQQISVTPFFFYEIHLFRVSPSCFLHFLSSLFSILFCKVLLCFLTFCLVVCLCLLPRMLIHSSFIFDCCCLDFLLDHYLVSDLFACTSVFGHNSGPLPTLNKYICVFVQTFIEIPLMS